MHESHPRHTIGISCHHLSNTMGQVLCACTNEDTEAERGGIISHC